MASPYIITGPVTIGTPLQNTIIQGGSTNFSNPTTNVISNFVTTTDGDLIYQNGPLSVLSRLAIGTPGDILTVVGTVPAWQASSAVAGTLGTNLHYTTNQAIANGVMTTLGPGVGGPWLNNGTTDYNDASFDAATGVFTVPALADGQYFFEFSVIWDNSVTNGGSRLLQILHNGATALAQTTQQPSGNSAISPVMTCGVNAALVATDTIEFQVQQSSGVSVDVLGTAGRPTRCRMFRLT